jgi:hypothetical protein
MTPTNDEIAVFTAKIASNARVNLYDKDYLSRIKRLFPFLFLGVQILLAFCFFIDLISQTQLMWSSLLVFLGIITVYLVGKRSCIASLKGETLIFKGIDSKSTITTLGSVRTAHTVQLLGIHITRLKYSLDGQLRSLLVFGNPAGMTACIDELIIHAKQSKKK